MNLSDNEIIKALECKQKCLCDDCKVKNTLCCEVCIVTIQKQAIDIINRQKAEVERLNNKVEELSEVLSDTIRIRYAEAKAEAIKAFAERLKEKAECYQSSEGYKCTVCYVGDIDNLVKEMVGDTE